MILPGFRGVAQGQQGSFLSGTPSEADVPRQPGRALCPRSLLRDPRPGLSELPAGPPSGAAAVSRRRGSASAPHSFGLERPGPELPGAQNHPSVTRKELCERGQKSRRHSQGVGQTPTPSSTAPILKNKIKTQHCPDASAPPARHRAASPWWRSPATPRARTSPPSMKLSRPLSGTGVPRGQWDRGSEAGVGPRPCVDLEAGPVPGRGGRASNPRTEA